MAEMTRRRMGELMRGVFGALMDETEGLPASKVLKIVEERVPPTPFEQATYEKSPNVRRFEKIVRFATISHVKAGWLVKTKREATGAWRATSPRGWAVWPPPRQEHVRAVERVDDDADKPPILVVEEA